MYKVLSVIMVLVLATMSVNALEASFESSGHASSADAISTDSGSQPEISHSSGGNYKGCPRIWALTPRGMEVVGKLACEDAPKPCTNLVCMQR